MATTPAPQPQPAKKGIPWAEVGKWALLLAEEAPAAIIAAKSIAGDKTDTQKAMDSLHAATGILDQVEPGDQAAIDGISQLTEAIITATQKQPPA